MRDARNAKSDGFRPWWGSVRGAARRVPGERGITRVGNRVQTFQSYEIVLYT
jgi:hypothetical protein